MGDERIVYIYIYIYVKAERSTCDLHLACVEEEEKEE